jgi:hypothetical protein
MSLRIALPLTTLLVAAALAWPDDARVVRATSGDPLADADDDFLPDSVEWIALTSAANADTDNDGAADFVEFVQRGQPRQNVAPLPIDHEMRIALTGPQPGATSDEAWLHVFVRRAEASATLTSFTAWLEAPFLPGVRIPFDPFALPGATCVERDGGAEGIWLRYSVPLLSAALVQAILPCSFHAEAVVGGRTIASGVKLFQAGNTIATLTRFDADGYAVQSIAPTTSSGSSSNRVCVLELQEIGSGPGGTLYSVVDADCEDCNELECALTNCAQSIGWVVTVPGGTGSLGGPN